MRLFCFNCAGGSTSFYNPLRTYLEPDIELTVLEYAGHGKRRKESFYRDFREMVDDLYPRIREIVRGSWGSEMNHENLSWESYALMGYSMGCISVVEILKKILEEKELPPPVHIFLAAHEPHTKSELRGFQSGEMDEMVMERTIRFGGLPEQLIHNRSFWRLYLPTYRADYSMIGRYNFDGLTLRTKIPATVFYSQDDTLLHDMEEWKRNFTGECEFIRFDGNHFFMLQHYQEIAKILLDRCGKVKQNDNG